MFLPTLKEKEIESEKDDLAKKPSQIWEKIVDYGLNFFLSDQMICGV